MIVPVDLRARWHALIDETFDAMERLSLSPVTDREFTQHDRPVWAPTRNIFLRAWRVLRDEKHPGVTARGKTRLMTRAAASDWFARSQVAKALEAKREAIPSRAESLDEEVLRELGARRVPKR